ncbi:MAG: hypothetical protein Q8K26_00165, partial [Candidatus Gracilibacteria bacterium]|nr:hypothetical protein [Candidatus Gracilibacteria bacterium]
MAIIDHPDDSKEKLIPKKSKNKITEDKKVNGLIKRTKDLLVNTFINENSEDNPSIQHGNDNSLDNSKEKLALFSKAIKDLDSKALADYFHAYGFSKEEISIILEVSTKKRKSLKDKEKKSIDTELFETANGENNHSFDEFLDAIIKGGNIYTIKEEKFSTGTLFEKSLELFNEDVVRFLITSGEDLNKPLPKGGATYLDGIYWEQTFKRHNGVINIIKILDKLGADLTLKNSKGGTLLTSMLACYLRMDYNRKREPEFELSFIQIMRKIIKIGVDIDAINVDLSKNTALMMAMYDNFSSLEIFVNILDSGPNPFLEDEEGRKAISKLDYSNRGGYRYNSLRQYEDDYEQGIHDIMWAVAAGNLE